MKVVVYEKVFLGVGILCLVACLAALFYASAVMGIHLPGREGELDPEEIASTPPFDDPGLRRVAPKEYEAVVVGKVWQFDPREIRVPVGSKVTFIATSPDVIHGFHVQGTRINMMLIPGQISKTSYRFQIPGEHLILCHEYCGFGHHLMYGNLIVEEE
ncbi:MAG: cytochrome c oxidase subunit II [Thermoanaerobaculia bacterium]|nr:cytochrome c oxidase subunit II [Thermoanaerobaculia bacterium]